MFLYTMLDLGHAESHQLRREIGFTPGFCRTEDEFQYLRKIAVRRGIEPVDYLGGKRRAQVDASRKTMIDGMLRDQYGVDVAALPPLMVDQS